MKAEIKGLTLENFFNQVDKESPQALKVFKDWFDGFKEAHKWNNLFNAAGQCKKLNEWESTNLVAPKFHELPFFIQDGILTNFFLLNDINYMIIRHPAKKDELSVMVDDFRGGHVYHKFDTIYDKELEGFDDLVLAKIAAINLAFHLLNGYVIRDLKINN